MKKMTNCSESEDDFFDCVANLPTELIVDDRHQVAETVNVESNDNIEDCLKNKRKLQELEEQIIKIKEEGNEEFKKKNYSDAARIYSKGLQLCPDCLGHERSILFANRSACLKHQNKKQEAITDCSEAIKLNPSYIKALLRRAELQEDCDKLDEALEDYKQVLELEQLNSKALAACARLPHLIETRNEKLKEEMLGTLKDLGNKFLGKLGLSTDNFQLQQNPDSGSYNIQFKQNP